MKHSFNIQCTIQKKAKT